MSPENQLPEVEWTDDAQPIAACMICHDQHPASEANCSKCNVALSLVHLCPRCGRMVSAKHLRCPYCSRSFIKNDELASPENAHSATFAVDSDYDRIEAARHQRRRRAVFFSVAIFLIVFAVASYLVHYQSQQESALKVIGTSYAIHAVQIKIEASQQAAPNGHLAAAEIAGITGVQRDKEGLDWFSINKNGTIGYVLVDTLAPPKGTDPDSGYLLLKASLSNLKDPSEIGDARQAVDLYRRLYPSETRREELLWLLAEKSRDLALRSHSHELLAQARKAYQELATGTGGYASRSKDSLEKLPDFPASQGSGRTKTAKPDLEILGASDQGGSYKVYDSKRSMAHKLMLLNQTEVLVSFSGAQQFRAGQLLQGQIASNVVTNGEIAVPAGSACKVKVNSFNTSDVKNGLVELQLQSVLIGGHAYQVDASPVQVKTVGAGSTSSALLNPTAPLLFRLRRMLILSQ